MKRKKLKILLVQPNFYKTFVSFLPSFEPLVMIMLASHVNDIADSVIFDRRFESERALMRVLDELKPDIVATRTHTSAELFTTKRILYLAKKIAPQATTIIGGQHPTLLPDDLNEPYIDLICIGPGEETFREVVEAKVGGAGFDNIKGLAIRKEGELIFTGDRPVRSGLFTWPRLQRGLAGKYSRHFRSGFTITSMGCPHRCNFCALWVAARGVYRLREVGNIVDDISSIRQSDVYIGDDNTFHDHGHAMAIYEGLKRAGVKKTYSAYARTDTIVRNKEMFKKWHDIGLRYLVIGFESVDEEGLAGVNKKNTLEDSIKTIEILEDIGIRGWPHFIIFPHFTPDDFNNVWKFVKKHRIIEPLFVPYTPLAGTPLYKEFKEANKLDNHNYAYYNLEYMVCKTDIPKWRWYFEYLKLWFKSLSPINIITFRRKVDIMEFIYYRIIRLLFNMPFAYTTRIIGQLIEEKRSKYNKIEGRLLPSQREGYRFRYLEDNLEDK